MIQFVTKLDPLISWRSLTTLERVTFSSSHKGHQQTCQEANLLLTCKTWKWNLQNKNTWHTEWIIFSYFPQLWQSNAPEHLPKPYFCRHETVLGPKSPPVKGRRYGIEKKIWFRRGPFKWLIWQEPKGTTRIFIAPVLGLRDPIPEKSIPTTHQAWSAIVAFEQVYCMPAYRSSSKAETPYFIPP